MRTQKELILAYVRENESIIPAKMTGRVWQGQMFGSEVSRRCRDLRKEGKLESHALGKFEMFELPQSKYQMHIFDESLEMLNNLRIR
jgi:hypothetical protein